MANGLMVDHYAALNLPPGADLAGVENAYARLSSELAVQTHVDETAAAALIRVNDAYKVLSHPLQRRDYDREFLAPERGEAERAAQAQAHRSSVLRWSIRGALLAALFGELGAVIYIFS